MRQLLSLTWKEWREVHGFLWVALGVFIALPAVGGLEAMRMHSAYAFQLIAWPWVYVFGGVFAVFVAAGTTCRDFQGRLEDFWRSRPVAVGEWLKVKYLVGLAVVLFACLLPLVLENLTPHQPEETTIVSILWLPFFWTALYSLAFAAGCLVRRTAHAAMLGLAAMLMVYTLPLVLPPLAWLRVTRATSVDYEYISADWPQLFSGERIAFAVGMLAIAWVAWQLAVQSVRREWHVESGRKMMYGSVSAAILILFASAGFQLGTNLPVLEQASFSPDEWPIHLYCHDGSGYLLTERWIYDYSKKYNREVTYRAFALTPNEMTLGSERRGISVDGVVPPHTPGAPEPSYVAEEDLQPNGKYECILYGWLAASDFRSDVKPLLLWDTYPPPTNTNRSTYLVFKIGNRLYVRGNRLATVDVSEPLTPRLISLVPFSYKNTNIFSGTDKVVVSLPPIPDLNPRQRLEVANQVWWANVRQDARCLSGDTLYVSGAYLTLGMDLYAYRLTHLDENTAIFSKFAQYQQPKIQQLFRSSPYRELHVQNNLLYATSGYGISYNGRIDIFDTDGGRDLRLAGHFAAPGASLIFPLDDGRALIAGSGWLWLVGPPPHHDSQ